MMVAFIACAAYRGNPDFQPDTTSLCLSGAGVVLIGLSGWLGATLVYRNQIAVDHRYANAGKFRVVELTDWNQPVCKASDLGEGQMMLAEIQGARIAVGRCSEGIVAFKDHCTHKGGPLSDGALVGCTVQCPWHGSQFDVISGRVVSGPADERILTYDVVTRGDDVFVYPKRGDEKKQDEEAA
jgi:nitrite reductase/ring-hydroxylating ferredoxin subunit